LYGLINILYGLINFLYGLINILYGLINFLYGLINILHGLFNFLHGLINFLLNLNLNYNPSPKVTHPKPPRRGLSPSWEGQGGSFILRSASLPHYYIQGGFDKGRFLHAFSVIEMT